MPLEWFVPIIVDNVFGYILDQSGIAEQVRSKLLPDPKRKAFKRALSKALEQFERQYPLWAASLFNADFFKKESAPILAQFLLPDGHPDPSQLAICWADSLSLDQSDHRVIRIRELEPSAADFLSYLNHALAAESDLRDLYDSRKLEQIADSICFLSSRIDTISNAIDAFRGKLESNQATLGTYQDYLHWLIERNLYLDPRGTLHTYRQVQVKLDEVYVSLRAQHEETPGSVDRRILEKEMEELERELVIQGLSAEELEEQREQLVFRFGGQLLASGDTKGEVLELAEVVTRNEKLVILGDPGSGKTTLLRYLALKHAQALYGNNLEINNQLGRAHFPILVRIADYAEYGLPKAISLSDFLVDYFCMHECPKDGLADLLTKKLAEGNCLVLLDGLDEIVSADERRNVVRQIEEFVRRHSDTSNSFAITSRIAGYRSASLGEPFVHFTVQEMDESQIRHFLEHWCVAVEAAQTRELSTEAHETTARREIEGIMMAVEHSQGVRRLAANPLLLRILALIYRSGAQLPQKRIELYRLAADTLARTWRTAQGVPESALVKDEYLTPLLSKLAYWLHVNKPTGIATEREVYEVLGEEWANLHDQDWNPDKSNTKIREEVNLFLLAVREHTGLFVERAPKRYGFMHLTFEEYYAARHLVARSKTRANLIRYHLHNSRWDEPILLALGFLGLEYSREAQELVETAILAEGEEANALGITPSKYEKLLRRDFLFALLCLEDNIPVRPKVIQRLIKDLAYDLLDRDVSVKFNRYRLALEERLRHLKECDAAMVLIPHLLASLHVKDNSIRVEAAKSLGQLGVASAEVVAALISILHTEEDVELCRSAAQSLGQFGMASPKSVGVLISALHDEKIWKRSIAAKSLGQLGQASDKVVMALLKALRSREPEAHRSAAESLGQLGQASDKVVAALLKALRDVDPEVRLQAIRSLEQLGQESDEVVAALSKRMYDYSPKVCSQVAESLGRLHKVSDKAVTALLDGLSVYDPNVCIRAAESLQQLGQISDKAVTVLNKALSSYDAKVRILAAGSLGRLPQASDKVQDILVTAVYDVDPRIRIRAVESLGRSRLASEEAVAALLKALREENPTVRSLAAESLGQLGRDSSNVIAALARAMRDYYPKVRIQAVKSLSQLGQDSKEMFSVMQEALRTADAWSLRRDVAILLGRIGQGDMQTINILLSGLLDDNINVRVACTEGLAQLGQRFPSITEIIKEKLVQAIEDPMFNKSDNSGKEIPASSYAYEALWLTVVGEGRIGTT